MLFGFSFEDEYNSRYYQFDKKALEQIIWQITIFMSRSYIALQPNSRPKNSTEIPMSSGPSAVLEDSLFYTYLCQN